MRLGTDKIKRKRPGNYSHIINGEYSEITNQNYQHCYHNGSHASVIKLVESHGRKFRFEHIFYVIFINIPETSLLPLH